MGKTLVASSFALLCLAGLPAFAQQGGIPGAVRALEARVAALEAAGGPVFEVLTRDAAGNLAVTGADLIVTGGNLHVRNGMGSTPAINGKGNLIVGYDESGGEIGPGGIDGTPDAKTGSHNLVVGSWHSYTSYGGAVVGQDNSIVGRFATVSGGEKNWARGEFASVSGGAENVATGSAASVSGGNSNETVGQWSSVSGGRFNVTRGLVSSVSGGFGRSADGPEDWAAGALFQDR